MKHSSIKIKKIVLNFEGKPISVSKFSTHVLNLHKDGDIGFSQEYSVCIITIQVTVNTKDSLTCKNQLCNH